MRGLSCSRSAAQSATDGVGSTSKLRQAAAIRRMAVLQRALQRSAATLVPMLHRNAQTSGGMRTRTAYEVGGWGGIRTHEGLAPLPVFKTGALNRSATHPGVAVK